jgi:transposase
LLGLHILNYLFFISLGLLYIFLQKTMSEIPMHIRHCILYEFDLDHNATTAAHNICKVYGEGSASRTTCYRYFNRFRNGDKTLEDEERPGRSSEFDEKALLALVSDNPRQSTRELAEQLGSSHMTVERHLKELGFVNKLGTWVPHQADTRQPPTTGQHLQLFALAVPAPGLPPPNRHRGREVGPIY